MARASVALGILTALIGVAGCSSADATPTPDATTSPLTAFLDAAWGIQSDQAQADADWDTFQGLIVQCMKDQGFTYVIPPEYQPAADSDLPDDEDWVAQWGYGDVTSPYIIWRAQTDADGSDALEGLSQSEQYAYGDALNGTAASYDQPRSEQGCWGASAFQVYGDDVVNRPENRSLMAELEAVQMGRYDDPALAALDQEWSDCMADAGFTGFEAQGDAERSVMSALQGYWMGLSEIPDESPELDALHDQEVALALVDLDCRQQTDYRARLQPIQWAAEERFLADHREELDAMLASAEAARAGS